MLRAGGGVCPDGPEVLYRHLQAVFGLVQEVLQEYEGTLIHQASEGFTAVFGAPVAQEDHARRAVLAALTLRQRLREHLPLDEHTSEGIAAVCMGLHSGWVVVGHRGHDAQRLYTAVGDPTELAMRLRHQAIPGTVLLSAATAHLVQEDVQVEASGTLAMDEGSASVPVYVVRGLRERPAGTPGHRSRAWSPFVGRERELALLQERLALASAGQGQVVSLVGEPGMGKTRLLAEFRRRLPAVQVTYYAGQCVSFGRAMPYHPVRDILRQLILHTAQQRPLVLAVENLHWCDATSEEWLASLVERLPGARLLLVVTYRPGYQPPWGSHSAATQLALPPLRPRDSWTVVQAILRRTPPAEASIQDIVAKAGGNPFFLEELARHAVEPDRPQTPVALPETVHAVLAARIDRLPFEAKHPLQTAAVLGNTVSVPVLRAIAEVPEEALQRGLEMLQAVEFLYETRAVPELTYTFKHALTQEVAYSSLLQARRRALHARLVEALETLYTGRLGEQVERLADHSFRGELWDKALSYCWQAGMKAFAHSAHREAVAWFEQALKALQHLPEAGESPCGLAMAYQGAGVLALRQGDFDGAIAVLERGLDLCRSRNLENWFYGLAAALGYAYALAGGLAEALPLLEEVVAQDAAMRGGRPLSNRVIWQGEAYLLAGRAEEAKHLALQALGLVRSRQERGHEAWTLRLLGEIAAQGEPPDAEQADSHYRQALALAEERGMRPLAAHCHLGLGTLYAKVGRREQARVALSAAIEFYRTMDVTFWLTSAEAAMASLHSPVSQRRPTMASISGSSMVRSRMR